MTSDHQPVGYDYNDGGISNQKITLLGLCVAVARRPPGAPRAIYLPRILSKDQGEARSSFHAFSEIFWEDGFRAFCARWNIAIVEAPAVTYADRIERGGWNYFNEGSNHLGNLVGRAAEINGDIAADFFRSLVPKVRSEPLFAEMCNRIFVENGIETVIQLRIEADWFSHCRTYLDATVTGREDYDLTAEAIVAKARATIPGIGERVYVLCDERYLRLPKDAITRNVRDATGIALVWKSDVAAEKFAGLTPVAASLLDFEIGVLADRFVGISRSTFSNLVTFESVARSFRRRRPDYIYNTDGPLLGLRTDCGTHFVPSIVCG